ncbi:MAG: hypothetical protein JRH11_17080 [Deltaproteobacteria bacterium]|nr:hypothetical protein [Deltaproteobacteria bacterium]
MRFVFFTLIFSVTLLGCGDDRAPTDGGVADTSTSTDSGGGTDTGVGSAVCEAGCLSTLAAACTNGPVDMTECVTTCEELRTGMCAAELMTYMTCGEGMASACDAAGLPVITACRTQYDAFTACLSM